MQKVLLLILTLSLGMSVGAETSGSQSSEAPGSRSSETLVSRSVGQVGEYVITSREVQLSILIGQAVETRNPSAKPFTNEDLKPSSARFSEAVGQILLEQVVVDEGASFSVTDIPAENLERMKKNLDVLKNNEFWKSLEATDAEIDLFIKRKMKSRSFLRLKTSSLMGTVSDQEAQVYFNDNRSKFAGTKFEDFKENIKAFLSQQQLQHRMKLWFESMGRKHKSRNLMLN